MPDFDLDAALAKPNTLLYGSAWTKVLWLETGPRYWLPLALLERDSRRGWSVADFFMKAWPTHAAAKRRLQVLMTEPRPTPEEWETDILAVWQAHGDEFNRIAGARHIPIDCRLPAPMTAG